MTSHLYKVCRRHGDRLISAVAADAEWQTEYALGEITYPHTGGIICVFGVSSSTAISGIVE